MDHTHRQWYRRMQRVSQLSGKSPNTQEACLRSIRRVAGHCGKCPKGIAENELGEYILFRPNESRWKPATLRSAAGRSALRYHRRHRRGGDVGADSSRQGAGRSCRSVPLPDYTLTYASWTTATSACSLFAPLVMPRSHDLLRLHLHQSLQPVLREFSAHTCICEIFQRAPTTEGPTP